MSEKIQRWRVTNGYPTFHSNRDGEWCDATDVSVLESRLAEAEKALAEERGVSSTTIAGCIKFEEENRALSARVRDLEWALGQVLLNAEIKGNRVVFGMHRDDYDRAARALKGEG